MSQTLSHDSLKRFSATARAIFLELKGTNGLTREEIKQMLREFHGHASGLEVDEALAQLMGRTPNHKKCYVWCDPCGRYRVLEEEKDPWVRACVIYEVIQKVASEGANYFDILETLVTARKLPRDLAWEYILALKQEGILVDECGKFSVGFDAPCGTVEEIFIGVCRLYPPQTQEVRR